MGWRSDRRGFAKQSILDIAISIMDAPFQDLTPTLARPRISPLVPQQPPPSPGTPGTPSTPVARPARSGKARDLLRQHYGMSVGPPAPLPGRPHDPMNIGLCSLLISNIYIYYHFTDGAPILFD